MKFIQNNLILIIIAGLCLFNIISTNGVKTDLKSYKKEIKESQKVIDSLNKENKKLTQKLDSVKNNILILDKGIKNIDNSIINIKRNTYEKVNNIDLLGNTELQSLFTARYYKGNLTNTPSKTSVQGSN